MSCIILRLESRWGIWSALMLTDNSKAEVTDMTSDSGCSLWHFLWEPNFQKLYAVCSENEISRSISCSHPQIRNHFCKSWLLHSHWGLHSVGKVETAQHFHCSWGFFSLLTSPCFIWSSVLLLVDSFPISCKSKWTLKLEVVLQRSNSAIIQSTEVPKSVIYWFS